MIFFCIPQNRIFYKYLALNLHSVFVGSFSQLFSTFTRQQMEDKRSRIVLNRDLVIEIYLHKIKLIRPTTFSGCLESPHTKVRGESARLSKRYGVSAKTIRDIWNRKSWVNTTAPLWGKEIDITQRRLKVVSYSFDTSNDYPMRKVENSLTTNYLPTQDAEYDSWTTVQIMQGLSYSGCSMLPPGSCESAFSHIPDECVRMSYGAASRMEAGALDPFHNDWPHWRR